MKEQTEVTVLPADTQPTINSQNLAIVSLADNLGYQGVLTVGALEDGIRFYQQRTVEDFFELGKRVLLLKEITPFGEFTQRLDTLGIGKSLASRLMSATIRFSKVAAPQLLAAAGNPTKLLELVALDDDELIELTEGGTVAGLTLDDVESMSSRDLRKTIREDRANKAATEQVLADKNQKIDELAHENTLIRNPSALIKKELADTREIEAHKTLSGIGHTMLAAVLTFQQQINEMVAIAEEIPALQPRIDECVQATYQRIADVSVDLGVQIDFASIVNPEWMGFTSPSALDQSAEG